MSTGNNTGKNNITPQEYHSIPKPGKLETVPTKPLMTQADLSLAYTPGVAQVCTDIEQDNSKAYDYTTKGNLVAVITNGTAVLGLGNIGALSSKPVMEGKAVLFKKFANIDCFDIEVDELDVDKFVDTVARLEPTFGGINLEDIKAPECFEIEEKLKERMNIPVMHDDQHGTAIILSAAFVNALHIAGKKPEKVKIVGVGAGAAGMACMKMLNAFGVPKKNIRLLDIDGVIYKGRPQMNKYIEEFACEDDGKRTLEEAIEGADVFLGLSKGGILKPEYLKKMAKKPIIFAMANPTPEIMPDEAKAVRPDAIVGTGRSDFPNQINNVLGFPYLFRGALDCGATEINTEMKIAAANAIAELARREADASLEKAYKGQRLIFGEEYLIPKPFDPRLLSVVASAVARAAESSGVAKRPIENFAQYEAQLNASVDQSFSLMRNVFNSARKSPKRVIFPDSEDGRVLRAGQVLVNEGIARPMFVSGRPDDVRAQVKDLGLSMEEGVDFEIVDPFTDPRLDTFAKIYYDMRKRDGLLPPEPANLLRHRWTAFAAFMVREGEADAMVSGMTGRFDKFLHFAQEIIGRKDDVSSIYAATLVMHRGKVYFIGDTHVNPEPTAEQMCEMTRMATDELTHFGIKPRVALLSHGNFGSSKHHTAIKQQEALKLIREKHPDIEVEGEMQADAALNMDVLRGVFPDAELTEPANILMMPTIDAANITFNVLRSVYGSSEYIGPILLGMKKPVHILNVNASVRQIVNMSALAVVEAQCQQGEHADLKVVQKTA